MYISPPIIFRRVTARARDTMATFTTVVIHHRPLSRGVTRQVEWWSISRANVSNVPEDINGSAPKCAYYGYAGRGRRGLYASDCYCIYRPVLSLLIFISCHFLTKCFSYLLRDRRSRVNGTENTYIFPSRTCSWNSAAFIAFQSLLVLIENPFACQIFVSILSASSLPFWWHGIYLDFWTSRLNCQI